MWLSVASSEMLPIMEWVKEGMRGECGYVQNDCCLWQRGKVERVETHQLHRHLASEGVGNDSVNGNVMRSESLVDVHSKVAHRRRLVYEG